MPPRKALGRDLERVLGDVLGDRRSVPATSIEPNPRQPRGSLPDSSLAELAESMQRHGVLQPLLVTVDRERPGVYVLVAGERRWRAARQAGLPDVPVTVIETDDRGRLELALVENLQRSDLRPLERARAYQTLAEDFGLSQTEIAATLGLSRPAVANTLRLLDLEPMSSGALANGQISEGHARALLSMEPGRVRGALLLRIIREGLSVREAERSARRQGRKPVLQDVGDADVEMQRLAQRLQRGLGTRVSISGTPQRGRIVIEYYGPEEIDAIVQRLLGD